MLRIASKKALIARLAHERGLKNVRIFGSVARGDATRSSDVDFLVDAAKGTSLLAVIGFQRDLAKLLGRKVDVGVARALFPEIKDRVLSEAIRLEAIGARAAKPRS